MASTAPAAPFMPGHIGSAGAWPTATVAASAAAHSLGLVNAAFAPIIPPDILDLDAWMDREHWSLGRLADYEPNAITARKRLDGLVAQEATLGRNVERIVSVGSSSDWRIVPLPSGGSEIYIPHQVWEKEILYDFEPNRYRPASGPSAYRGIPVVELPF